MKKLFSCLPSILAMLFLLSSCEKEKTLTDRITFEEMDLGSSGFYNGSDGSGTFSQGNAVFPIRFNSEYQSWNGFAVSKHTNNQTGGYANQYSSITGSGAEGSSNYAVLYTWSSDTITFRQPQKVTNISLTNSAYAYFSMLEGDGFSKKFGGSDGNDPDYFRVLITPLDQNRTAIGTFTIDMADYTPENNLTDYIADIWFNLDLSEAGFVSYLVFSFDSSDKSDWGINTPTYVCIDNIYGELKE